MVKVVHLHYSQIKGPVCKAGDDQEAGGHPNLVTDPSLLTLQCLITKQEG